MTRSSRFLRALFAASSFLCVILLVACGGGNSNPTPPPPTGNFSNASLNGQYAFSLTGTESGTGAYSARVGSFSADGNGHILGGLQDILNLSAGQVPPESVISISGGSYAIQSNGRGVLTLNGATGQPLVLSLTLASISKGFLVETDALASASGNLLLQTPSAFAANSVVGKYVFDLFGISFAGPTPAPISTIGQFAADGNGNITGGVLDQNDGSFSPSGPVAIPASTYQLDTNGNGSNFGRGTVTLNGRSYAFYIVDAQHLKLLQEDNLGGAAGDATLQSGVIPSANSGFAGSFVFEVFGSATTSNRNYGPDGRAGRFTSDGNGGISTLAFDDNNDGNYTHVASSVSNSTYTIDTANAGSGRGTFTFTSSSLKTLTYVFYLYSPTQAVIQDVSPGVIGDGTMLAQATGPINVSNVQGNYAFHSNGLQLISPSPLLETFVGQYAQSTSTSGNMAGTMDYTQLGLNSSSNSSTNAVTLNAGISGTLTLNGDGTQTNGAKVAVGGISPFTLNYIVYYADTSTALFLCEDSNRTNSGIAIQQTQ